MKKLFFSIGLILVLIGIAVASNYNSSKVMRKLEIVNKEYDSWTVSGELNAGDKIRVICYPGKDWDEPYSMEGEVDDYVPVPHRHIWFEITDPNGSITEYNTAWTSYGPSGESIPFSRCYVNVTIVGDGIEPEAQYPTSIGGFIKLNGTYIVRVVEEFDPPPFLQPSQELSPPTYLAIEKEYPVTVYPFTYLLPTGISFSMVGIMVSTWAARSRKRKNRRKQKI